MGLAAAGLFVMAMPIGLSWWMARRLRREGASIAPAIKHAMRSPNLYFGLMLVAMAVSRPAGEAMFAVLFVGLAVVAFRLLLRLPAVVRAIPSAVRRIGDPAAWRAQS